jgi:hypothetical protein
VKRLTLEAMEDRVLLSHADLTALVIPGSIEQGAAGHPTSAGGETVAHDASLGAHIVRSSKSPTALTVAAAGGVKGGTATLTATLTSNGVPLAGAIVAFQLRGHGVGKAVTNAQGVATLSNASLKGIKLGSYASGVVATFGSDATHAKSSQKAALTVSRFATTLSGVSGSGPYGGSGTLTATLTSGGAGLAGQTVSFQLGGQNVGSATTNGQGVASLSFVGLAGISGGAHPNTVTASFAGSVTYARNSLTGPLTVSPIPASVSLGNLTQTFNGTAHSVTATTNPSGLAYAVTYTDASGNTVASPTNAGTYQATATITDPSYSGSATGSLVIAPSSVAIILHGLVQTYDGTAKSVTATTSTPGLVYTVSYKDANGNPVARPTAAGSYHVTVSINVANYTGTANSTFVITPAQINVTGITASNKVYDGGTAAAINTTNASLVGIAAGDQVTLNTSAATGAFATGSAGTDKTVSVSGLTLSGADAGNYTLTSPTTTANITVAPVTVSGLTAGDKVYDGTDAATLDTTGASLLGVVTGDRVALDVSHASAVFTTSGVGTDKAVTVTGLALTGADAGNYILSATTVLGSITPAPLTVTGVTALNKVYEGTANATIQVAEATIVGAVPTDAVALSASNPTGTFASQNVGTDLPVTVTGLSLIGADAGNYTLTPPALTANITPAPLTVTGITANNKVYDGTTAASLDTTDATLVGAVSGDSVTLDTSGAIGSFATKDVGTGRTVTVSGLALTGADMGNYTLTAPTATANITAAPLTVTGITANNKTYDGTTDATLDATNAKLVGAVSGDVVTLDTNGATGTFAAKSVGTGQTVTVSGLALTGADAGNYTVTAPTTTADIAAAPLTVTGITANNKVYDGTNAATLDFNNPALVGVVAGDDVQLDTSAAMGTFAGKDVGTGVPVALTGLSLKGAAVGNYVLTAPTPTANITPVTLTVTGITAGVKTYDGTASATLMVASPSLVGVLAGDVVMLDATHAVGTFATKDVGLDKTVTIGGLVLSGADAGNYVVAATTTADVTAATLTVTGITAKNKPYDGTTGATLNTSGATLVGLISGDAVTLDASAAIGTFATKDVGMGQTVTVSGLALAGADAENYLVILPTATADITPAVLTVTGITAADKVYDGTTDATLDVNSPTLVGVVSGEDVTLNSSGVTGAFASKDVGTGKPVTVSGLSLGGAAIGNYMLSAPTLTANITPLALTVTGITANDKVYDGTTDASLDTGGATLLGVLSGDTASLVTSGATGAFATKNVGTVKTVTVNDLALSGGDAGNYVITPPTTTANITAATLTVSGFIANDKPYDGTTAATFDTATAALVGVASGDHVSLDTTGLSGTFATENVGAGQAVTVTGLGLTGTDAGNYLLTIPAATASITPAVLTVTGITASNKLYDGTTDATLVVSSPTLVGVVAGEDVTLNSSGVTGAFATKNVGTARPVTVSGLSLSGTAISNYVLSAPTPTANITALALTVAGITADNKVYDGTTNATINTTGASIMGVLSGDAVTLATSDAMGSFDTPDVGTGKTVTVNGLALTGPDAGNYVITPPTTTANITAATLTVSGLTANDKPYDGTTAATFDTATAALVGVTSSDHVALDTTNLTGTFATKNVGTAQPVSVSGLALTGSDAGNYVLTTPTATASITPAVLTVTGITASNKVYDGKTDATLVINSPALVGVVSGEDVTLNSGSATGAFATKDVGTGLAVTVSGLSLSGADSGNYVLTAPTPTANITPAPLTVGGLTANNKVYDGTLDTTLVTSGATLMGVVSGDAVNLVTNDAVGVFATKGVGVDKEVAVLGLALEGADAENYALFAPILSATITAAPLTVTGITAADKPFDGTTAATLDTTGAMLAGAIADDAVTLVVAGAVGTFDTPEVGSGKTVFITGLTLNGADAGNYALSQPTTTASILPAP